MSHHPLAPSTTPVPGNVRGGELGDSDEVTRALTVRILMGTRQAVGAGVRERLLHVEATDETDP